MEFGSWQKQNKAPGEKLRFGGLRIGGVTRYAQSRSQNGNPGKYRLLMQLGRHYDYAKRSFILKNLGKKESLSRRNFLSGSVAATLASLASPGNLPAFGTEKTGQGMASSSSEVVFRSGKPIWPTGREKEMNLRVGFRAEFEPPPGKTFICVRLVARFTGFI